MFISEDGTVTGSVDVSKLDEIKAKTPEARAQLDVLKAERKAGQEQAARDAERLAEQHAAQAAQLGVGVDEDEREKSRREQRKDAERQQAEADAAQQGQAKQSDDVTALQAEAEAAGVTIDKRWGADRLRTEIDAVKAARPKQR